MEYIKTENPRKNKFDLSREVKMTMQMGKLYPAFIQEIIPGDSLRVNSQQMLRFSPLLAPVMHNIDLKMDYFFVPYRLIWDEWKDFITGGEDGDPNTQPSFPRFKLEESRSGFWNKKSLADYMGLPVTEFETGLGTTNTEISALPFRAYQLIWHEYFRDQNVGFEYKQHTSSGLQANDYDTVNEQCGFRFSNWEKDYFTSALPFLQRGPEVELPLGKVTVDAGQNAFTTVPTGNVKTVDGNLVITSGTTNVPSELVGELEAVTINELRKATALQRFLEVMARGGSRYREQIHAIFGERIPDYTVAVPQYLGGGKTPVMISEVLSTYADASAPTSGTNAGRPLGDPAGHALALGDGIGFKQSFQEHGIVLGLVRVIPRTAYFQGINKMWQKFDQFDHYFPQFANLGEQEVNNIELVWTKNDLNNEGVFGYQQRYAEYKYSFNRVAGDFRDELDYWHMARKFASLPNLNQAFIQCSPEKNIFAVTDTNEDELWLSLYHKVDALRPMPYHSVPSLT